MSTDVIEPMADSSNNTEKNKIEIIPFKNNKNVDTSLLETVYNDMLIRKDGLLSSSLLLGGSPGNGKTSFAKLVFDLAGIPLVVVEVPHVVEENIINIPFITFEKGEQKEGYIFDVKLANSYLYSVLNKLQKESDADLIERIYKDQYKTALWEMLGGTKESLPDLIYQVRLHYNKGLFNDEYYRKTSVRIRNIYRDMLNNKIGMHDIQKDTYLIYASNISDIGDSLDTRLENEEFRLVSFESPKKDDWFSWFVNTHPQVPSKIIDVCYTLIDESWLDYCDVSADVRVSPRRWEQFILCLYAGISLKNKIDNKCFITSLYSNFKNYLTGKKTEFANEFMGKLCKVLGLPHVVTNAYSWREVLECEIQLKVFLGDARTYIPTVSGKPGIGKTHHKQQLAYDLNMILVQINCSTINADDGTGLPLSETIDGKLVTKFSKPPLLHRIERIIEDSQHLIKDKKAFAKQKYKYILFFDEATRTSEKVQNTLRRPMLNGSFSDEFPLPEGTLVVTAINPTGNGVSELTHHMRDVINVIDAAPYWGHTKNYLMNLQLNTTELSKNIGDIILFSFLDHFKVKHEGVPEQEREFYIDIHGNLSYLSPRALQDLYVSLIRQSEYIISKNKNLYFSNKPEEVAEFVNILTNNIWESIKNTISSSMNMYGIVAPQFMEDLKEWLFTSPETDLRYILFTKEANIATLDSLLSLYLTPDNNVHAFENIDLVSYLNATDPVKIAEDLKSFILKLAVGESGDMQKYYSPMLSELKCMDLKTKSITLDEIKPSKDGVVIKQSIVHYVLRELLHTLFVHKIDYHKIDVIVQSGIRQGSVAVLTELYNTTDSNQYNQGLSQMVTNSCMALTLYNEDLYAQANKLKQ